MRVRCEWADGCLVYRKNRFTLEVEGARVRARMERSSNVDESSRRLEGEGDRLAPALRLEEAQAFVERLRALAEGPLSADARVHTGSPHWFELELSMADARIATRLEGSTHTARMTSLARHVYDFCQAHTL